MYYHIVDTLAATVSPEKLKGRTIQQSTILEAISDYCKTSKLIYELHNQLQAHNDSKQYLTKICVILNKICYIGIITVITLDTFINVISRDLYTDISMCTVSVL